MRAWHHRRVVVATPFGVALEGYLAACKFAGAR